MEVTESKYNLGCNKLNLGLREPMLDLNMMKKFTAWDVVHDEVDSIVFLEHEVHIYNEWVLHIQHYKFLKLCWFE